MLHIGDCIDVAADLELDAKIVLAVANVESNNAINAFLFEPHVYSHLTQRKYDESHPHLSYPTWDRRKYLKSPLLRQRQFDLAAAIEPFAAYEATSWGLFQIMGYHYKVCRYFSPVAFATDMKSSIEANMKAFGHIIRSMELIIPLREHNWARFAKSYNGPAYKANHYDIKLAASFAEVVRYEENAKA